MRLSFVTVAVLSLLIATTAVALAASSIVAASSLLPLSRRPRRGRSACRFAPRYSTNDILNNATLRHEFLVNYVTFERNFTRLAINEATQLTYDGHRLDVSTGLPIHKPHLFSAPSKESLHVALLARVLEDSMMIHSSNNGKGNAYTSSSSSTSPPPPRRHRYSHLLYTVDEALLVAETKVGSYEKFAADFPGFGGFLPWFQFHIDSSNVSNVKVTPAWNWNNQVPSLDNGELFWAAFALSTVLESYEKHHQSSSVSGSPSSSSSSSFSAARLRSLCTRWTGVWRTMSTNAVRVFYAGNGTLRTVSQLTNQLLPVSQNNYSGTGSLDDPYEGEMFTDLVYLFSPDLDAATKDLMWIQKRAKLQAASLPQSAATTSGPKTILTQRGWWFSAHEQWKYSFLPYRLSEANWRVFRNGERARAYDGCVLREGPGLFASTNGPVANNNVSFPYDSACGVQALAFQRVLDDDVYTPYGGYPFFLLGGAGDADGEETDAMAAAWLHRIMSAPRMQNQWGSTEATFRNGTAVAPLVTWDTKITTVVALLGGVVDIVQRGLEKMGQLQPLISVIDREWSRVFFPNGTAATKLPGEELPFHGPPADKYVPRNALDFTSCQ